MFLNFRYHSLNFTHHSITFVIVHIHLYYLPIQPHIELDMFGCRPIVCTMGDGWLKLIKSCSTFCHLSQVPPYHHIPSIAIAQPHGDPSQVSILTKFKECKTAARVVPEVHNLTLNDIDIVDHLGWKLVVERDYNLLCFYVYVFKL